MTRWFAVESADESLFTSAPHVFRYTKQFAAPPELVWESLSSDESLAAWSPTVSSVKWTSDRPFGVGTTREVVLAPGVSRVRERFFRWDEGYGYSFQVYEANTPFFRRFAEDYVVEPAESDGTASRFIWTIAIEPKTAFALPFKPIAQVLKLAFGKLAADGERYFAHLN